MSRTIGTTIVFCFLLVLAPPSPIVTSQEKGVAPPAPVPAPTFTAKKVFLSNEGLGGTAFQAFRKLDDVDQP